MDTKDWKVNAAPTCPHCKTVMEQMDARYLDWGLPYLWVCFNNNCAFFMKGWKHMMDSYGQLVSYRFMIQPDSGAEGVIPAFSHEYIQQHGKPGNPYLEPDACPGDEDK
jgi:hypothetical protein